MTECERIIKEGILPKSFFKEEVRCDFKVSIERKKIWAIQLDLLKQVDIVCKRYNLKYFLMAGSLLGAVRHRGYVPWDDDLDIVLSRKDYERFLTLGHLFKFPYFLQTPHTDKGYYYSHAKLRNSRTAAIDYPFLYQGFNMGIYIDIHPLDAVLEDGARKRFSEINKLILDNSVAMRLSHPFLSQKDKERVKNYSGDNPIETYEKIQKLATVGYGTETDFVSVSVVTTYGFDRCIFKREDFSSLICCDFEGFKVHVPCGFDRILRTTYGDYNLFPPIEQRGVWHENVNFYPDEPYKIVVDRMKEKLENDNRIYNRSV